MILRGIRSGSLAFAAVAAGYAMFLADHWLDGFFGLFGVFPGTESAWWMLTHHLDSVLFALLFAWKPLYDRLPGAGWTKGLVFGLLWAILVSLVALIGGGLGAQPLSAMGFTPSAAATNLVLHLIWGFVLGALYLPVHGARAESGGQRVEASTASAIE